MKEKERLLMGAHGLKRKANVGFFSIEGKGNGSGNGNDKCKCFWSPFPFIENLKLLPFNFEEVQVQPLHLFLELNLGQ